MTDVYWTGVNIFPTYPDSPASLNTQFSGAQTVSPLIVDDDRLNLLPGNITRIGLLFETGGQIKIDVEIDGKWPVMDGGHIII